MQSICAGIAEAIATPGSDVLLSLMKAKILQLDPERRPHTGWSSGCDYIHEKQG